MLHVISSLPLAGMLGLGAPELLVIVAIFLIGLIVSLALVVGLGFFFRDRERRRWHETARLALEKGQALPPQFGHSAQRGKSAAGVGGDFRAGLVLVGTGIGLYFFLGFGIAAIVGFIGLALLLYALGALLFSRKNSQQDPTLRS